MLDVCEMCESLFYIVVRCFAVRIAYCLCLCAAKRGVECRLIEALVGLISDVRDVAAERLRSTHMFLSPEPLTKHEEEEEGKDDFDLDTS